MALTLKARARTACLVVAGVVAAGSISGAGTAGAAEPTSTLQACEDLAGLTIGAADIGLPTLGATITSAARQAEVAPFPSDEGENLLPTPPLCLVLGNIASVDPAAPPINFAVNLPLDNWNGRALQSGGGGLGGSVVTAPGNKGSARFDPMPVDAPYPITLGYVTFGSDGGHSNPDYAWTASDEALRNWAHEHLKKTKDVATKVIEAAYGRGPDTVFFSGESAGGREAVRVAQEYPDDYDGIIATSPVLAWYYVHLADNRLRDALVDGFLDADDITLVADRTRASCDAADGLVDGVIARYLDCANDVAALRCPDGLDGAGCLSDAQIRAVDALRDPYSMAVPMPHGVDRFPGFGVTGDEDGDGFQWSFYPIGTVPPSRPLPPGRGFEPDRGAILNFGAFLIRHTIVGDDTFDPYGFNPATYTERIQYLAGLFEATDGDLSEFASNGGKLIIVHPSADNATPLTVSAEFERRVVATMGEKAADDVLRLYVGPGGSHNVGGTTQIDALSLLENWALDGETPPDAPVAFNKDVATGEQLRSLPACRYPTYAQYDGSGDPNSADSFACTEREDPLAFP